MILTVKRTIEIEIEIEVTLVREDDDCGCGLPSETGNRMTGCRGWYWVKDDAWLGTPIQKIKDQINSFMAFEGFEDAIEQAQNEGDG